MNMMVLNLSNILKVYFASQECFITKMMVYSMTTKSSQK